MEKLTMKTWSLVAWAAERVNENRVERAAGYYVSQPSKHTTHLDVNNLYGWVISPRVPTHGFTWMNGDELNS
jgi:hypothetical protein